MKKTIFWTSVFALMVTSVHADDLTQSVTPPTPTPPVINCDYKIPETTKTIDQELVIGWAEKALIQAFSLDPSHLDSQLQQLQSCFTEQGWTGFNTALQKSGNLEAIKSQKLTVSSQVEPPIKVSEATDNQWKLNIPLQVIYQNDKGKVTQLLSVDVTVGRKITGELGITQMIAAPKGEVTQEQSSNPVLNNNNPPPHTNDAPNPETPLH